MVMDFAMFFSLLGCETLTNKQFDFFVAKVSFFPNRFLGHQLQTSVTFKPFDRHNCAWRHMLHFLKLFNSIMDFFEIYQQIPAI